MKVEAQSVERFCNAVLRKLKTSDEDAKIVAQHLVDADLRGVRSHGLLRLIKYVDQIDSGYIDNAASVACVPVGESLLRVDGNRHFGIVAFHHLLPRLTALARQCGIAGGAVVNCAHTGRVGAYTEALAREFMWSLVFGGGGNRRLKEVAPFGGSKGVFDTNPYAFSMPLDADRVASSDFATSSTAQGKLLVFRTNKTPVPEGWIIDKHGHPTTNAEDFYDGGAMLPSGGAKGYGMGFMAELFGDAALGTPHELHWFMVAVDLRRFAQPESYFAAAARFRAEIEACPPSQGVEKVMWPGQPEAETSKRQLSGGIEYSHDEIRSIAALETRFSVRLAG
jgi:LDH2 family malate/lactate/ureidoglycolate dehydrogenase